MGLTFNYATIDDLLFIVAVYNSTIKGRMVTADTEEVTVESRIGWFTAHNRQTRPLFIVNDNDKQVGWLSYQDFYGRPAYNATAEISIYIEEQYRGKGYGRKILQYIIDTAEEYGIKTLLGFVFSHNAPSLKLFYSMGFTDFGNLKNIAVLDGIERSLTIVGKRVG